MSAPTRPLVVTLVDDNDLSTAGLTSLLAPFADRVQLLDAREALTQPSSLDVVLHEPLGCSALSSRLRQDLLARGRARSVIFTWAPEQELTDPTSPVLTKSMTASQLVRALEDIVQGRYVATPPRVVATPATPKIRAVAVPDAMAGGSQATTSRPAAAKVGGHHRDDLSERELQVLTLITRGLTNEEIGAELGLSINSIKTYVRSAYRKAGISRRTQAVAWGLARGLLEEQTLLV